MSEEVFRRFGLRKGRYILTIGRFVPEKGFHDLIAAFRKLQMEQTVFQKEGWKLVIVGKADHQDAYATMLERMATETPNVILTGFLTGRLLQECYAHAGLFVLPSSYEGLPIAALEAMSYGLACLVTAIPANEMLGLPQERFFRSGDVDQLARKIDELAARPLSEEERCEQIELVRSRFDWDRIAEQTLNLYHVVLRQAQWIDGEPYEVNRVDQAGTPNPVLAAAR